MTNVRANVPKVGIKMVGTVKNPQPSEVEPQHLTEPTESVEGGEGDPK